MIKIVFNFVVLWVIVFVSILLWRDATKREKKTTKYWLAYSGACAVIATALLTLIVAIF